MGQEYGQRHERDGTRRAAGQEYERAHEQDGRAAGEYGFQLYGGSGAQLHNNNINQEHDLYNSGL